MKPAGLVGDGWWCWCTYHHTASHSSLENQQPRTRAEKAERNHRKTAELVRRRCAHGVLVYAGKEPVGWCQFGPRSELPRIDSSRNYQKYLDSASEKMWRITCFVIDKRHRKRGVAILALSAALDAISRKGGGSVEGYPVSGSDQGPNYFYSGTVSMFAKAGFKTVGPLSTGRTETVVMRKTVDADPSHLNQKLRY